MIFGGCYFALYALESGVVEAPAPVAVVQGSGTVTGMPVTKEQREIERKVDELIDSLLAEPETPTPEPQPAKPKKARKPKVVPLPKPIREPAVVQIPTFEIPKASWSMDTEADTDDVNRLLLCAGAILTL